MFKSLVFGGLGFLAAGIFTSPRNALIAGAVAAAMAMMKYVLRARREDAKLLEALGGDKQKLKALKQKFKQSGAAGGLIMEMLRGSMDADEADEDVDPLSAEELVEIRAESQANLERVLAAIDAHPEISLEGKTERVAELEEQLASAEYVFEARHILAELLEERTVSFGCEDYIDEDDHASLVELFAEATLGAWTPADCKSSFDDSGEKCTVSFKDNGGDQTWRFNQNSDYLSENFLRQLKNYAEERSGLKVVVLECSEHFEAILLPHDFCQQLAGNGLLEAA